MSKLTELNLGFRGLVLFSYRYIKLIMLKRHIWAIVSIVRLLYNRISFAFVKRDAEDSCMVYMTN
ncbi:hypothetical protein HMPREF1982_01555 [Clostridiales bacterium oral taxon 876 str. F0540]|nr:hypothetical protein HMPREF1982_01555 [Clostridiales bacterium oral taxon 876 str. F0540]